jgi:DNA modification methylase
MSLIHHQRVEFIPIERLKPYSRNARTHSKNQVRQIARSIERFGFTNPALIDEENGIVAGHGRVLAAQQLGITEVPCLRLSNMTEADKRAYILADNKLAQNAGWDKEILAVELEALIEANYEVELTGFSVGEADIVIGEAKAASTDAEDPPEEHIPDIENRTVTRPGEIFELGRHRLICGDARSQETFTALFDGDNRADMMFADPPYNVPITGHASGNGEITHREFAMGVGEMSRSEFIEFLKQTLGNAAGACHARAIAFTCIDWRHMWELQAAGEEVFADLKNVCVWNKTNAGMGTFYRSKHELVFVYKIGNGEHINNFGLGETGRHRTNVWDYAGANTTKAGRMEELEMHPTVKPVGLVADAILDVTKRGDLVLDPFGGSGTTLIAAHKTGRTARLIEYDPHYCDVIIRRFEAFTGKKAKLAATGDTFEDVADMRLAAAMA